MADHCLPFSWVLHIVWQQRIEYEQVSEKHAQWDNSGPKTIRIAGFSTDKRSQMKTS
ncbi:unnamed protein product [Sphenostylis stenocarpa]|uniref:Uncharacterized protein n=1 Tax=Sphenostylis stenocarpa TaxID=92480 RepID=A0AA86VDK9_9FABA|nr:unnamed protein product [Sphenostylis stenocarpa]